jgi:metal-responsive CopG/Arc/MetJ family transcriptional regulator
MLRQLDERAARLNVSRQAIIKTLLSRALDEGQTRSPRQARKAG